MLATLGVQPDLVGLAASETTTRSSDRPDDWYETTADEQLRFDQCLMADAVRLGAPRMYGFAQDALNQPSAKLREMATLDGSFDGPLRQAHEKDRADWRATWERLHARRDAWERPVEGLETPGGFTVAGFEWVPGVHGGGDFYDQTGLGKWAGGLPDWTNSFDFYDPTPEADARTLKAVTDLGAPLYSEKPYDPSLTPEERNRQYYEQRAFEYLFTSFGGKGADDTRLFLASGGFPRSAPQPGTAEYRIAVEDMKTRFASCAWRDPIDPNKALRGVEDTAALEWQQEITSQAAQRNQILDSNKEATAALTKGAEAMADMLGQSWIADHLARWQDYWAPGGLGWIGNSSAVIQVEAAKGKCLDVAGAKKDNGTPVQLYTCNNGAAQQWEFIGYGDGYALFNVNAQKCLDVQSGKNANGTKIQIWACNGSKPQTVELRRPRGGRAEATRPRTSVWTCTRSTTARTPRCGRVMAPTRRSSGSSPRGTRVRTARTIRTRPSSTRPRRASPRPGPRRRSNSTSSRRSWWWRRRLPPRATRPSRPRTGSRTRTALRVVEVCWSAGRRPR